MESKSPFNVDIVIPVLNEELRVGDMLDSLGKAVDRVHSRYPETRFNIMVVDGGSTDATVKIITEHRIAVMDAPTKGRGNQIAAGIKKMQGDWIVILHADITVRDDALVSLIDAVAAKPDLAWGIFGHDYDCRGMRFWLTRLINRLRFDLMGLGYGDQGQFVKRSVLNELGGFPEQPLMEDVELSLGAGSDTIK